MVSCNKNAAPGVQMAPGSLSLRCLQRPLRLNCGVLPAGRESIPTGSGFVGWQVSPEALLKGVSGKDSFSLFMIRSAAQFRGSV